MIGLLSLILLSALGIVVATLVVDANRFKSNIESSATNAGIELAIEGNLAWQLYPLGLSVERVNFTLSNQSMAGSADQLSLGVNLSTIFSLLNQRTQLPVSRLSVTNGRVLYALPANLPLQFSQIDLSIEDLNSEGQKFPTSLDLVTPKGIKVSFDADVGLLISDQKIARLEITDLQLKIDKLLINGYFESSNNLTKIQGQLNSEAFDLIDQFKLVKRFVPDLLVPKMADKNALTNISFDSFFDITVDGVSKTQTSLSIDGQPIDIDIVIDQPQYKLSTVVSGKTLNLNAYRAKPTTNTNNSMLFAPLAIPMAVWHGQSQLEVNLKSVELGELKLSNLYANLFGNQNIFRLTALSADTYGGQLNATAMLNMQRSKASFSVKSSVSNIDLGTVTQAFEELNIGGKFNLEANIQGSGDNTESIIQSLKGGGALSVISPVYKGINLEQTLCNAAALFGGKPPSNILWPEDTQLDNLTAKLRFAKDRLLISDYQTKLGDIDIYGNASINLLSQRYTLNTTALASKTKSSANGCKINQMIVKRKIPFRCKGALGDKINCKPDNNLIQTLLLSPKL